MRVSGVIAVVMAIIFSAAAFSPSAFSSVQPMPSIRNDSYFINGTVYLYDGTSAGGYNAIAATSGAPVTVRWFDSGTGTNSTLSTTTDAVGFFSVSIYNCTDGGLVELKARFVSPYLNWGYNYTYIDMTGHPGGRVQNIVCGVPYEVKITNPLPGAIEMPGVPFPSTYVIYDRDGSVAKGYFTFSDGPMKWISSDALFLPPAAKTFNGISTGGSATGILTLYNGGYQWLNISEGGSDEFNPYLTPWGNFIQIINGVTSPGFKDDWDNITVIVLSGGGFDWNIVEGWNLVSCPMSTYETGSNGYFDAYDALKICHWQIPGFTELSLLRRLGGNPSSYERFDYGMPESSAFVLDGVHGYWVYCDVSWVCHFNGTAWPAGGNVLTLSAGWNMVGFTHDYTVWNTIPTAKMFTDGTISPTLGIGIGGNYKIIASKWNFATQCWVSYVTSMGFPGITSKNWQWDFSYSSMPGNGLMLWVETPVIITFNKAFGDSGGQPESCEQPIVADAGPDPSPLSGSQTPLDPYPIYGYVKWGDGSLVGPGAQVFIEWVNTSGPWTSSVIHDPNPGCFPVITNALSQYSIDMMSYDQNSIIWGNATINGISGYNTTWPNFPFDGGKMFNIMLGTPLLSLTKTGPANANPGQTIVYTIEVTNVGNVTAYNLNITDIYPGGVTFVSSNPASTFENNVWIVPILAVGASVYINITVQVSPAASGTLVNYAELTYEDSVGIPQPPSSDMCSTVIVNPCMTITKTGPATANPGETITYTISYTNIGTDTAYNVVVTDTLPFGVTYVSAVPAPTLIIGQVLTWNIGTVAAGASGMIQIQVTIQINVPIGMLVMNYVELTYDDTVGNPQPPVNDTCITTIIDPLMLITKWGPATASPGDTIVYWLNYTNAGTDWAYNVTITETYPPGVTFISAIPAPSTGDNVWYVGAVAPGASGSIMITVQVNAGATGNITNYVQLDYWNSAMPLPPVTASCTTSINPISGPVHNLDTDEYFNEIQAAIDDPDTLDGHTIEVSAGTYYENVFIDKALTLIGENRDSTIIDANWDGNVVQISINNVTISGFSIIHSESPNGYSGIDISYSSWNHIFNNNVSDNYYGMLLYHSDNNIIENNYCTQNEVHGIYIECQCNENIIANNTFSNTKYSIALWESSNNVMSNNTCQNNWIGIYLFTSCDNNIIENNSLIFSSTGGVILHESSNNSITNNTISNSTKGIQLGSSSPDNKIYHNSFIGNTIQATDDTGANQWDNGYPSGGNYWSDYSGVDMFSGPNQDIPGSDGIGDTPYAFDFAQDNYPLWPYGTNDTAPPEHLNEQPPVNGESFNLTPVISVDVIDILSGVNASTIRLYVSGFMVFYNLDPISNGYTVSYWHEGGFTEGQNVSCRIVAKDYVGNTLDFTWHFTAAIGEQFIIDLHGGWNLLSFPLIPVDTSIEGLFGSISGNWDVAKWFDPNDPADPWKTYRVGNSNNDLISIDNTMGFWLHVTDSSGDLIIHGNEPVTTNIMLKAGWNLVSYPCQTNKTVATALWGTGADHVEAYDGSSPTLLRELGPGELMGPGNGYWVHVPTDAVWIVTY